MRAFLYCLSAIVLALFSIALPRTDASGANEPGSAVSGKTVVTTGQGDTRKEKPSSKRAESKIAADAKAKRDAPITPEIEAEVTSFVRLHHRELIDVLARLKNSLPKEYERAVRELNRQRLRLKQLEGRDRYDAELNLWKAQSRVRLLGARMQMGDDRELRAALREKLAEIYDLREALLQRDRDRAAERLKKLDNQLQAMRDGRDASLKKQLSALAKDGEKRTKPVKTNPRNTPPAPGAGIPAKKPSTKTID